MMIGWNEKQLRDVEICKEIEMLNEFRMMERIFLLHLFVVLGSVISAEIRTLLVG